MAHNLATRSPPGQMHATLSRRLVCPPLGILVPKAKGGSKRAKSTLCRMETVQLTDPQILFDY